jgi:hypothetical protein
MQTFLPYPDFARSARALDMKRLGKQRVEARQILDVIRKRKDNPKVAWGNHPAVLMWIGYENALILYGNAAILEWIRRGYRNNMPLLSVPSIELPPWLGDPAFHASHRSNLLRKDPEHYSEFSWDESPNLPYVWPRRKDIQ